ncbi:unnamed protein product [Sphagnum tenellum]
MTITETMNITPNFNHIFDQFLRESSLQAMTILRHSTRNESEELSRFRNFIVALNIAVQSCTDKESLLKLREEVYKISTAFAKADDDAKYEI